MDRQTDRQTDKYERQTGSAYRYVGQTSRRDRQEGETDIYAQTGRIGRAERQEGQTDR